MFVFFFFGARDILPEKKDLNCEIGTWSESLSMGLVNAFLYSRLVLVRAEIFQTLGKWLHLVLLTFINPRYCIRWQFFFPFWCW